MVLEVDKLWLVMQRQLISQLSTDIQLPKCLQVIGHLRQMAIFTETELRLKFLQARNSWLEKSLKDISQTDGRVLQIYMKHNLYCYLFCSKSIPKQTHRNNAC